MFYIFEAINNGLNLQRVHTVIKKTILIWILNLEKRYDQKNPFEKDFYKIMKASVFDKNLKNVWNHRNIKLVNNDKR